MTTTIHPPFSLKFFSFLCVEPETFLLSEHVCIKLSYQEVAINFTKLLMELKYCVLIVSNFFTYSYFFVSLMKETCEELTKLQEAFSMFS